MTFITSKKVCAFLLFAMASASTAVDAQSEHERHRHEHHPSGAMVNSAAVPSAVPPLKILMPEAGDRVGSQLAVVFETPADLAGMTMGAAVVGVHLHVQYDDIALMPTFQQLIRLGKSRYLYLFDLPATLGSKTLRVYWSDAQHNTIKSTMQEVSVIVVKE